MNSSLLKCCHSELLTEKPILTTYMTFALTFPSARRHTPVEHNVWHLALGNGALVHDCSQQRKQIILEKHDSHPLIYLWKLVEN